MKGAIRDIGRALGMDLAVIGDICNSVDRDDNVPDAIKNKYPELFEYVEIVSGTITSIGSHPCGVLISDRDIESEIGMCSTSGSPYPISVLYMKELDQLNYVKWDVLGLDNVSLINETCKLAGIDRITPDNIDLEDADVWKSIRDDTTMIFQFESDSAQRYLKKLMSDSTIEKIKKKNKNFSMIKLMSFANGLIRPSCASFRDDVAEGESKDNGIEELNEFLAPEMGHISMQETIMQFLVKFCGYTQAGSDTVRRAIGKKRDTSDLLPEVEEKFISYTSKKFNVPVIKCAEVIKPFIQTILDASKYGFSWNHSDAYSCIGYACGYLRYYYPLEFVAAALNIFAGKEEKTANIVEYAQKNGIKINNIKFGKSRADYFFDKEDSSIYKGVGSVKFLNNEVAEQLYELSKKKEYTRFVDLAIDCNRNTSINSRQMDILIRLDYFSSFGNAKELLRIVSILDMFKWGDSKTIKKEKMENGGAILEIVEKYSESKNKNGSDSKSFKITDCEAILRECEDIVMGLGIKDFSFKDKIEDQKEFLGYISLVTGREEDRPKLYVKTLFIARKKTDNTPFGINVTCQSIGSGKQTRYTIFNTDLKKYGDVKVGDIIYCSKYTKNNGYFTIKEYKHVFE